MSNPSRPGTADSPSNLPPAIRSRELILFCRQLAAMLSAGTNILRALMIVQDQIAYPSLRSAIEQARTDMTLGLTLAHSLGRYPHLFSPFFIDMIRQGEGEGMLAEVLNNLADYLEREQRLDPGVPPTPYSAATPPAIWQISGAVATSRCPETEFRFAIWCGIGVAVGGCFWAAVTLSGLLPPAAAIACAAALMGLAVAGWGASELRRGQAPSNERIVRDTCPELPSEREADEGAPADSHSPDAWSMPPPRQETWSAGTGSGPARSVSGSTASANGASSTTPGTGETGAARGATSGSSQPKSAPDTGVSGRPHSRPRQLPL